MKERPILFSAPMVRAIWPNQIKDMTRRTIKEPFKSWLETATNPEWIDSIPDNAPFQPGMRLWVREEHYAFGYWIRNGLTKTGKQKWSFVRVPSDPYRFNDNPPEIYLKSRHKEHPGNPQWYKRLARFMPRAASRITLEITGVRAERLQDISEADAVREGIEVTDRLEHICIYKRYDTKRCGTFDPISSFRTLWESINGPGSWDENPYVWVITFKVIEP